MKNSLWRNSFAFVLSILAVPALTLAAPANMGGGSTPMNQTSTMQAENLLNQMRREALKVNDRADFLRSEFYSDLDWRTHAQSLDHMADQVRKMDGALDQLRTMQNDVAASQSQLISQVTPQVMILTDTLNGSIRYLNRSQNNLMTQTYHEYIAGLYSTSQTLSQELRGAHRASEF